MGLAQDLLDQAQHLAVYQAPNHTQAALRRSVSTAYYALFHLLVEETAQCWQGSAPAVTGIERALNHGPMKNNSRQFDAASWRDWHGVSQPVRSPLRRVAKAFIRLQEDRLTADYDNHAQWTITDVQALLQIVESAFEDWHSIRTDPMAGNYLLAMLLGKQR